MKNLDRQLVMQYIEKRIGEFHNKREEKLHGFDLRSMLKHKNPYLFKAKNILTAQDLIKGFLDSYLQTQEETFFGDVMQDVATFVCGQVFSGERVDKSPESPLRKFDLQFQDEKFYYLVEIKTSWNWGNSSQIRDMISKSKAALDYLQKKHQNREIIIVNGCCFGKRKSATMTGGYFKICGQQFWKLISGDDNLYIDIIEPIGHRAKERSLSYQKIYAQVLNKFTLEFAQEFCDDGIINWERIVKYVSEDNA